MSDSDIKFNVGVVGGGQLAQMLAQAGKAIGVAIHALVDSQDCPAASDATLFVGDANNVEDLKQFTQGLDSLSFEFENVNCEPLKALDLPIHPPLRAMEIAQDRALEKQFFVDNFVPTPRFEIVNDVDELKAALKLIGLPCVVKTTRQGYDGKGQRIVKELDDVQAVWDALNYDVLIVEQFVNFEREVSMLAVRTTEGELGFYPLVENQHEQGILFTSKAPFKDDVLQVQAKNYAKILLEALDYVGVLAVEFFKVGDYLIANEMAPRVHNSGHWTIEGAKTSQFENHLRAVCGLPLGDTVAKGESVMVNLISHVPPKQDLLALQNAHLHLYGKAPREGRKLGHITLWGQQGNHLSEDLAQLTKLIQRGSR